MTSHDFQDISYISFSALTHKKISIEQFVTTQTLSVIEDGKVQCIPLFNASKQPNERALQFIRSTFALPKHPGSYIFNRERLVDQKEEEKILKLMGEAPESEKNIWLFQDVENPREFSLSRRIHQLGFNIFSRVVDQKANPITNPPIRILPSYSLMKAFFQVKFGRDAIMPYPVLGTSSMMDLFSHQENQKRDAKVPFLTLDHALADSYLVSPLDFIFHDYYHAYVASCVGPTHTKAFLRLAAFFLHQSKMGKHADFYSSLAHISVDMEFPNYRPELRTQEMFFFGNETSDMLFWVTVNRLITRKIKTGEDLSQIIRSGVFFDLALEFRQNKDKWAALGVTQTGLDQAIQRLECIAKAVSRHPVNINELNLDANLYHKGLHPLKMIKDLLSGD